MPTDSFAKQVRWFQRRKWSSITFPELLTHKQSSQHTVLFTFDDAYSCAAANAAPVLLRAKMKGTFFVVPGLVGKKSDWDTQRAEDLADWNTLKQLQQHGFALENHTKTHPRLSTLSKIEALQEIKSANEAIHSELGYSPTTLCYPYGDYSKEVQTSLPNLGIESACTVRYGMVKPDSPDYEIPRVLMACRDGLGGLLYKLYIRPHLN